MSFYGSIMIFLIAVFGMINLVRMTFFMVGSDLYTVRMARIRKNAAWFPLPTFTVVIPAHNEERTIASSLLSVIQAKYEHEKLQIIVVDDGSTDATTSIARRIASTHLSHDITIISQPNAGKAHALNHAMAQHARGELVMCLDADSSLEPHSLINAARYFLDSRVVALSANIKIRATGTLFNVIQSFEYLVCYQMKRAQTFFNIEYIIGGIGSTFRHSALKAVGYYDTDTVTEDIDLTMKLLQRGSKKNIVSYGSDVIAYTESVLSLSGLIRQRFRWKWGRGQTFYKHWNMFFSSDDKHAPLLTWVYLPFALISDIAFFFEPFLVTYIAYIVVLYSDFFTLLSAFAVISSYIVLNIIAEDTISWRDKIKLVAMAPSMYIFFYVLSFAEYIALIRTYWNYGSLPESIGSGVCGWEHVERARA